MFLSRAGTERRLLTLSWEDHTIRGLQLRLNASGELSAEQSFDWELPAGRDDAALAAWLRERFQHTQGLADEIAIVLPAAQSIIQHVPLPVAPDEEIEQMLRLQMANSFAQAGDYIWRYDGGLSTTEGRRAIVFGTPASPIRRIVSLLSEAGKRVVFASISTVAAAEVARELEPREAGIAAFVARTGQELQIVATGNGELALANCQPFRGDANDGRAAQQTVRTILGLQHQLAEPISRVELLMEGELDSEFAQQLEAGLGVPLVKRRLGELPKWKGDAASVSPEAVGIGLASFRGAPSLNLVEAGERARRRRTRSLLALAAAAVALILLSGGWWLQRAHSQSRRIVELTRELDLLDEQLRESAAEQGLSESVRRWVEGERDWLLQIRSLARPLERQDAYLERMTLSGSAGDLLARARATGQARSEADVRDYLQALVDSGNYRIRVKPVAYAGHDTEFPIRFELDSEFTGGEQ